jgi:Spy/CpxP family protein refolding chaperone
MGKMNKWKMILGVMLLLVLGAVMGSIATEVYFKRWFLFMGGSPKARAEFIMKKISKDLKLTQEQNIKIGGIVEQSEHELQKIKRLERKRMLDEIKMELNNDQQRELESFKKESEKRRQRVEDKDLRLKY